YNNVLIYSWNDTNNNPLPAGSVGLRGSTGAIFDNFNATPQNPQSASLPFTDDFDLPTGSALSTFWGDKAGSFSSVGNVATASFNLFNFTTLNGINVANAQAQATVSVPSNADQIAQYAGVTLRY